MLYSGYMTESRHMYDNAGEYEGNAVTVVSRLSKNQYICPGYEFVGWNTMPDGSGTFYSDEQEIYNLTSNDCNLDSKAGTVTLYAMWRLSESTLIIDPGEGKYNSTSEQTHVKQRFLSEYDASKDNITSPDGFTIYFETGTAQKLSPITGTMHFGGWGCEDPFAGRMEGTVYHFTAEDGNTDTIRAEYVRDSIKLPDIKREGWSFGGWYYDEELKLPAGTAGDSIVPAKDMTLYACWVDLKLSSEVNLEDNAGKGAVDLAWEQPDGKQKIYKIYQRREGENGWSLVTTANDIGSERYVEKEYAYSEKEQTFFVPYTGFYTLTANGAQGGNYGSYSGGQGGKVSVKIWLCAGEKLTIATGGINGYNGGGSGTMYAAGGGYTIVSSNKKGTLLVAGGGGGASIMGDGKPGGATEKLLSNAMSGESGESGGGGGYRGGKAGETILHSHTASCYSNTEYDAVETAIVSNYWEDIGDDEDAYDVRVTQIGSQEQLLNVQGNNKLTIDVGFRDQGGIIGTICIYNQDGLLIGEYETDEGIIDREEHNKYHSECLSYDALPTIYGDQDYNYTDDEWTDDGSSTWLDGPYPDGSYRYMKIEWSVNSDDTTEINSAYALYTAYDEEDEVWVHRWTSVPLGAWIFLPAEDRGYVAETEPYRAYNIVKAHYPEQNVHFCSGGIWSWDYMRVYKEFDIPAETTGIYIKTVGGHHSWTSAPAVYSAKLSGGNKLICGYTEGQVVSAYPAYGGSNYINTGYAASYTSETGAVCGNGYVKINSGEIGYVDVLSIKGVCAADFGKPGMIEEKTVTIEAADDKSITVEWDRPPDTGTTYYHYAESYIAESTKLLCTSNITADEVITGIAGYYIVSDYRKDTVVNKNNGVFSAEEKYMTEIDNRIKYVHIAAVDKAGNMGETLHLEINPDRDVAWKLYTEQLSVKESDNIYKKEDEEKVYYVRCDGLTPFEMDYNAGISGFASGNYQVNYALFESECMEEKGINGIICPTGSENADYIISDRDISLTSEGNTFLSNYPFTAAGRSDKCRKLAIRQKFILGTEADGKRIDVIPRAGADTLKEKIVYSDYEIDLGNSVTLIGDGEGPTITGFGDAQQKALIDRDEEKIVLEVRAEDLLSGVKEFYIRIENTDNVCEETLYSGADNSIEINITGDEPVFSGDFNIYLYACDNVGNETIYNFSTTEFAMQTQVERILEPHEPVFQAGESGNLLISVWGYPDKVEVIFPEEMTALNPELNTTLDYTDIPQYRHDEKIQFMVPLYTPEGSNYEITVRAYKGDKMLEQHPRISVLGVSGTVLDDFRTRLR
jgi:hypothetical protein